MIQVKRPATRGMEIPCKYRFVGSPKELNKVESCLHGQTYKGDEKQRSIKTPSEDVKKSLLVPAAVSIPTSQEKMSLGDVVQENSSPSLPITYNDDKKLSNLQTKPLPEMVVLEKVLDDNDNDGEEVDNCLSDPIWVTHDRHVLRLSDKMIIESGELSDKRMLMAQYCIKKRFPLIGGLHSTLMQEKVVIGCTTNTIQFIHCQKRSHWITVSTKWCQAGQVNVYDTAFDKLDSESRRIVKAMFSLKSANNIHMVPVQKQQGVTDCGVFAIALMTSIAFNEDPSEVHYQQDNLRQHLLPCFVDQKMTPFPRD